MNLIKKAIIVQCALLIIFLQGGIALSSTDSIIDQVQPNDLGWYIIAAEDQTTAQTFIPGIDGMLSKVSILLSYYEDTYGSPGDLVVEIRSTSLGVACVFGCNHGTTEALLPAEEVLASVIVPRTNIPSGQRIWVDVNFPEPALLTAGTTYAIVLYTTPFVCTDSYECLDPGYRWFKDASPPSPSDPYPDGEAMARASGTGYKWSVARLLPGSGRLDDYAFKTYMESTQSAENMKLDAGWSIISLPVAPSDKRLNALFPEAVVVYGYEKGKGYVRIGNNENLEVGSGYWILLNEGKSYTLTGCPIHSYTHSASADGWAMIGGCTQLAQVLPHGCEVGVIYGYNPETGYEQVLESELLQPYKGYWILLNNVLEPEAMISVETVD